MIYTSCEALAQAAFQIDLDDKEQVARLSDLIRVYFDALNNAPCDIVGVGRITWAEDALVDYQLSNMVG